MNLFVTDLDGSLLNTSKEIPSDFYQILDKLKQKNDLLFIASGRSKEDIITVFDPSNGFSNFICDNGAIIIYNNEVIYHNYMNYNDVANIVEIFKKNNLGVLVLSGIENSYRIYGDPCHHKDLIFFDRYYTKSIPINSLDEIKEGILKITIQSYKEASNFIEPHYKDVDFIETTCVVAGLYWYDFFNKNTSKGVAISKIQKILNISFNNSHCFGDYLNDLSMKDYCKHSYALANAHETVIKEFSEVIDSNNQCGVTKKIKEIIGD